jgi:dipeptidase D
MSVLSNLKPNAVWGYFEDICQVPRPSKKEEKIIAYLLNWAKENNIEANRDKIGNVIMKKPATPGKENLKSVIMQSHMDMVCEKNSDHEFDFNKDAIQPWIDGEWVKAKNTTLGADDGIGVAAQMAVLTSTDIAHGPIECLFTVDEETGLSGAFAIQPGFFDSRLLLNLDSEDEGEIFIGCAGGVDTLATFDYVKSEVPEGHIALRIDIKGLKGGHSGDEIHKGHGNSNKILNRILWFATDEFGLKVNNFDGGNLRNAIPREASAIVTIPAKEKEGFTAYFNQFTKEVKYELQENGPDLELTLTDVATPEFIIDEETQYNLLNAVYACPHGVFAWSYKLEGLVETSTNLASVKFVENEQIVVTTSQRSSVASSLDDIANMVETVFSLAGAVVKHTDGYPGWAPNPKSEILDIASASYERLYGKKPVVRAIHAGLECGLFLEKYPDLDMISFGPTLRGVHSPDEKINIETVDKWWKHLVDVLESIPAK